MDLEFLDFLLIWHYSIKIQKAYYFHPKWRPSVLQFCLSLPRAGMMANGRPA